MAGITEKAITVNRAGSVRLVGIEAEISPEELASIPTESKLLRKELTPDEALRGICDRRKDKIHQLYVPGRIFR